MRGLVVIEYVSLDGVIQAPGHANEDREGGFAQGGWTRALMVDHQRYNDDSFQTAGAFLLGRKTYEIWAGYWPTVTDERNEIATALNTRPKYVASTTMSKADWAGTTVIRDVRHDVAALKQQHDLVDEYQLWLHPVILGGGKRLFRDGGVKTDLRLIDSRTSGNGLVILTYQPRT